MNKLNRISSYCIGLFFLSICFVQPVFALELDSAKASGLVGEQTNGYLGAVSSTPSAEVQHLVNDINQKRKKAYQDIATKNGTKITDVEKLAAQKAIEKTAKGHYIQTNGQWVKK